MTECYYCGCDSLTRFNKVIDFYTREEFEYLICEMCGLIQLNKQVGIADIDRYYPQNYSPYLVQTNLSSYKKQVQTVHRYIPKACSILDVGCGRGDFLRIIKKSNKNVLVAGIEFNDKLSKYLQNQLNITIFGKTLDDLQISEPFDLITMWDVFEHLSDPIKEIQKITGLLKKEGSFVFSIPNTSSIDRKIFGNRWIGWDAPRHTFLFSDFLIRKILNEYGYEVILRKTITGSKGSFDLSMKNVFGEKFVGNIVYKIFSFLLFPYRKLTYLLNLGPVVTYITQKRVV